MRSSAYVCTPVPLDIDKRDCTLVFNSASVVIIVIGPGRKGRAKLPGPSYLAVILFDTVKITSVYSVADFVSDASITWSGYEDTSS